MKTIINSVSADSPLISVVMAAYNAEKYIGNAIYSVMQQTWQNWELIIVDDLSTDRTFDLVNEYQNQDKRIRCYRNNMNCGAARSRNNGIYRCLGSYIAILDSDDMWRPDKLEKQMQALRSESADMAYCSYGIIDKDGHKVKADYIVPEKTSYNEMLRENIILCSSILVKADVLRRFMFNTEFYHEDYVLELDILRAGYKAVGCSEVLASWRYIDNSRSYNKKKSALNRWRIYRKYLRLSLIKSCLVFACYVIAGLKKYA